MRTKKKGIKVSLGRIDRNLPFKDKEFDFAICNVTLQMVMYPEVLLKEMKRRNAKLGLASLCVGGGQGGAIILER